MLHTLEVGIMIYMLPVVHILLTPILENRRM